MEWLSGPCFNTEMCNKFSFNIIYQHYCWLKLVLHIPGLLTQFVKSVVFIPAHTWTFSADLTQYWSFNAMFLVTRLSRDVSNQLS